MKLKWRLYLANHILEPCKDQARQDQTTTTKTMASKTTVNRGPEYKIAFSFGTFRCNSNSSCSHHTQWSLSLLQWARTRGHAPCLYWQCWQCCSWSMSHLWNVWNLNFSLFCFRLPSSASACLFRDTPAAALSSTWTDFLVFSSFVSTQTSISPSPLFH